MSDPVRADLFDGVRVAWAPLHNRPRREVAWSLIADLLPGVRISNTCPSCGGSHGPVRLTDQAASVSYAGGFAVVAVAAGVTSIGVDAESAADTVPPRLERVLPPGATLRDWVRVEAVLKADGRGLRVDPGLVRVDPAEPGWTGILPDRDTRFAGRDVTGPPDTLVSLALA